LRIMMLALAVDWILFQDISYYLLFRSKTYYDEM
jgi:hypothetical protein